MKLKDQFSIVRVEWIDSCEPSPNAEVDLSEVPNPQRILQAGFLVRETEQCVSIAGAFKPECKTFDYVITIPKFAIVSMTRVQK